jgi:MFS family permease
MIHVDRFRRWPSSRATTKIGDENNLLAARIAIMFFFLLDGTLLGSWFVRIPEVQQDLGLSNGTLGLALLGSAAGALVTQPATAWMIAQWGSRRMTIVGAFAQCAALTLPSMASGLLPLILALVVLGGATGVIDVAMNVQGAEVERRYARPIMTTFHAFYSVGGLLGAMTAGLVTSRGVAVVPHLFAIALLFAMGAGVARHWLLPTTINAGTASPAFGRPSRALGRIAAIAFCVVLAEGAMGDWSAVYLQSTLAVTTGLAAGGYAAFSLTMTVGRLAGGWMTVALGAVRVVRLGGALVAIGLGMALLASNPGAALLGFACVGLGLSCSFPATITAAGRIPGMSPGAAIAAINTAGYTGFLAGPPLIGLVAEGVGLRSSLGILALVGMIMIALGGAVDSGKPVSDRREHPRLAMA